MVAGSGISYEPGAVGVGGGASGLANLAIGKGKKIKKRNVPKGAKWL